MSASVIGRSMHVLLSYDWCLAVSCKWSDNDIENICVSIWSCAIPWNLNDNRSNMAQLVAIWKTIYRENTMTLMAMTIMVLEFLARQVFALSHSLI